MRKMLRPSASSRWMECPGSEMFIRRLEEERMLPADTDTEWTRAGTFRHKMMELLCTNALSRMGYLEPDLPTIDRMVEWAEDIKEDLKDTENEPLHVVEDCHDAYMALAEFLEKEKTHEDIELEKGVSFGTMKGTVDVLLETEDKQQCMVVDWKFGFNPVDPRENTQLMTYAVMANEQRHARFTKLVVVQRDQSKEWEVKEWTMSPKREAQHRRDLEKAASKVLNKPWRDNLVPGRAQCRFCDAKPFCPKVQERTNSLAEIDNRTLVEASPDNLARFYKLSEIVIGLRNNIERMVLDSGGMEGFVIEPGRKGNRRWSDQKEAERLLEDKDWAWDRKLKTPTQLEKSDKRLYETMEDLVTRNEGTPKVRLEEDSMEKRMIDLDEGNTTWALTKEDDKRLTQQALHEKGEKDNAK